MKKLFLFSPIALVAMVGETSSFSDVLNDNPFYLEGEFLWWTMMQSGQDYVASKDYFVPGSTETTSSNTGAFTTQGEIFEQNYGWKPGMRLIGGYHFKDTNWTIQADYTAYNNASFQRQNRPDAPYGSLRGVNNNQPGGIQFANTATSKTVFHYRLGREHLQAVYAPTKDLEMSFLIGLAETSMNQVWRSTFVQLGETTPYSNNIYKWKYRGVGMNVGGGLNYYLGKGFEVGGDLAQGALYGPFETKTIWVFWNQGNALAVLNTNVASPKEMELLWLTQMSATIAWSYDWNRVGMKLAVGYEASILNGPNVVYSSAGFSASGAPKGLFFSDAPINLQGLVASAGLAF
jgi:hypothetical protein